MMMGTALRAFAHPTDFLQRLGTGCLHVSDTVSRVVQAEPDEIEMNDEPSVYDRNIAPVVK